MTIRTKNIREYAATEEPPLRILIVEDNKDQADSLAMLLQARGHDTRVAYSAHAALETAREFRPEVLLLDLNLPQTNGYDLAAQLREQLGDVVLMATTGMVGEAYRQKALDFGFQHFFLKPVNLPQLREALEAAKAARQQ